MRRCTMDTKKVKNGQGGDLRDGFEKEATGLEGIAVLGGASPTEIADYMRGIQERRAEDGAPEADGAHCDM